MITENGCETPERLNLRYEEPRIAANGMHRKVTLPQIQAMSQVPNVDMDVHFVFVTADPFNASSGEIS